ncbi:MAG: mechanosensitive ion channel family protein [Leptolyngbyaceae cyanobacterium bins.349]|nr:mechanosensitive ion channel family protein [Leptolyngbyaceae cyanobacterium bins.349]
MTVSRLRRLYCFLIYSLSTLLLVMLSVILPAIAVGQLPAFTGPNAPQPLPVGVVRRGTLESAPVRLDGRELFRIASPAVLNRTDPGMQIPVEVRAKQVEANLIQVIENALAEPNLNPATLRVIVEITNGLPVLSTTIPTWAETRNLLTVTDTDAQFYSTSRNTLAQQWQKILELELRQALKLRHPEALRQQVLTAITVLVATVVLTVLLGSVWSLLKRRKQRLKQQQTREREIIQADRRAELEAGPQEAPMEGRETATLEDFHGHFSLERRLQTVQFCQWFLFWAIALIWVVGIAYSLNAFPQTRFIARKIVTIPIVLLITWFLTGFVNRLTDLLTDRFIQSREREQSLTVANLQRITTIARVVKGLKMVILYTLSLLWVLQWLNLASGTVLTLGAVLALAVSFAAQNLIKDIVNGFLILIEDQFRIGDMVTIGTHSGINSINGLVENLNLRLTQLRNPAGSLITIPNSTIAQVENMSRNWARADFQIEVAYDTDVDQALKIVRQTIDQMAQDSEWQACILDTREVFGVEQLTHTGITIRAWIKTLPLKQWDVARELRRRLKLAFERNHIQIGMPQQVWQENGIKVGIEQGPPKNLH